MPIRCSHDRSLRKLWRTHKLTPVCSGWASWAGKAASSHLSSPMRSNHLRQNASVPKFLLITFSTFFAVCTTSGDTVSEQMHKPGVRRYPASWSLIQHTPLQAVSSTTYSPWSSKGQTERQTPSCSASTVTDKNGSGEGGEGQKESERGREISGEERSRRDHNQSREESDVRSGIGTST